MSPLDRENRVPNIRVAAIQTAASGNAHQNWVQTESMIRQAATDGAQLVCLQELFLSRYFCQTEDHRNFDLAESIPGPTSDLLAGLARELQIVIVGSLFERRTAGLFHNTSIVVDIDGQLLGKYRKMHIPEDPCYYEKFYFTPGDLGFRSFETSVGAIGVCICWDQWFPEAARLTALSGAEILVYPTAIGWLAEDKSLEGESQVEAWKIMMQSHAISNGVFVIAANRVGTEESIEFWGNSFVARPNGSLLAEADRGTPQILAAECNLDEVEASRTHWPFLRDRRIDAYQDLTRRLID